MPLDTGRSHGLPIRPSDSGDVVRCHLTREELRYLLACLESRAKLQKWLGSFGIVSEAHTPTTHGTLTGKLKHYEKFGGKIR